MNEAVKDALFLCEEDHIPYWSILLDRKNILLIDTQGLPETDFYKFGYNLYDEWITYKKIEPRRIKRFVKFFLGTDYMPELCEHHVLNVSELVVHMTRVATHPDRYVGADKLINHDVDSLIEIVAKRLSLRFLNEKLICDKLSEIGDDGDYTMCDRYCVNERYGELMLWEQLLKYDFDSNDMLHNMRDSYVNLSEYIRDYMPWTSKVKAGGYTG